MNTKYILYQHSLWKTSVNTFIQLVHIGLPDLNNSSTYKISNIEN